MSKYVTIASWDDAPHLTEEAKQDIFASIPPYLRDAMTRGIPVLGSGAIYPIAEKEVTVADFAIPEDWPKSYGMDVGWRWTAAAFFTQNPATRAYYLYSCYKKGQQEPSSHATAIRAFGPWIPGVIDPAANGRSQKDGLRLLRIYRELGLNLRMAQPAAEAGVLKVWQMLSSGALKVFASCAAWFEEFRNYQRDKNGNIVKKNDHLVDCTRFWALSGMELMRAEKAQGPKEEERRRPADLPPGAWMV